jgi:hypothetical protein
VLTVKGLNGGGENAVEGSSYAYGSGVFLLLGIFGNRKLHYLKLNTKLES